MLARFKRQEGYSPLGVPWNWRNTLIRSWKNSIGTDRDTRLSEIFDALLHACEGEAKSPKELQDCVAEGIATLKSALRKVKV
jgi:hypothetical protein